MTTIIIGVKDRKIGLEQKGIKLCSDPIDVQYGVLGAKEIDVLSHNVEFFDRYKDGLVVGSKINLAIEHTPMNNKYIIFTDCTIKSAIISESLIMFTIVYDDVNIDVDGTKLFRKVKLEKLNTV